VVVDCTIDLALPLEGALKKTLRQIAGLRLLEYMASSLIPGCGNLYLICDGETCERHHMPLGEFIRSVVGAGVKIVQYRHKNISAAQYEENLLQILPLLRDTILIVNDHAEIAMRHNLTLHLGQDDTLPPELPVPYGRSTHSLGELDDALSCNPAPAYIALGTMFASRTKPDVATNRHLVAEYLQRTSLPLVLIGGITLDNVGQLPKEERVYYAMISDVFRYGATPRAIAQYVRLFAARQA
jgi:thiamine-phosphate diphosphorylase